MSPQPATYNSTAATQNPTDVNPTSLGVPYINTTGFGDCGRPEDQYQPQFFSHDASTAVQQPAPLSFITASRPSLPFFQDGYSHGIGGPMMTMVGSQNICTSSGRIPSSPSYHTTQAVPQALYPLQASAPYFSSPLQFATTPYDPTQDFQQESVLCRAKRQRDENYRYSLGCITRRVRCWLEKSRPYARAAQTCLEDELVRDTMTLDGADENFYELFDEPRRKRFCPAGYLPDGNHTLSSASHSESSATCSGAPATTTGVMSNPFLFLSDSYASPRGMLGGNISASDDMHGSCAAEQEFVVKFPKQIPPICPTAGMKVQFEELTNRSVLRNWRCRTDEADVIFRKGRRRFFRRVAVLPPDFWQPNKRPQTWEWAPSGPFALNLGEFVSISGTNGYPYEIVSIRHIPPAIRCFLSLVPVPRDLAIQMLNGEKIAPESNYIIHAPVDSVTHKWILNGIRPRDFTRDMALEYIDKDIEMERLQKERRKTRVGGGLSCVSVPAIIDPNLVPLDSVVAASSPKSLGSNDSVGAGATSGLVLEIQQFNNKGTENNS